MRQTDIGAHITTRAAGAVSATAGGGDDGSEVDGPWIDRQGFLSCKAVVVAEATLAATETLSIAANLQDAADASGTGAADFGDAHANAVLLTGGSGGTTEEDTVELDFDLTEADQFIRLQFTPTFSAASTDTGVISGCIVLGGAKALPAS